MFTIYAADILGDPVNCLYPHKHHITDDSSIKTAVGHDYVCAKYKNNYRCNENFIGSDCLPVDCDNDHSENPDDWITPDDIKEAFPGVSFAIHFSRHNNRSKNGAAPRPKFHVLFPIDYMTDGVLYSNIKKRLNAIFPYFDKKALDAARFFYGTSSADVVVYDGIMNLNDFLDDDFDADLPDHRAITQGSRNATMSHFAGRVIKRYGDCEEAYNAFLEEAEKCTPPLSDSELNTIWHSAQKFYAKVSKQAGYISPDAWENSMKPDDYSDIGQAKVLAREYEGELVFTESTDYLRYDGTHWSESRQLAVGACEEFLDRQLEDAVGALDKAKQSLIDMGVSKEAVQAGGKALEKEIDEFSAVAFKVYQAAMKYYNFVMKRRDMKYVLSALQAAKPMLLKKIQAFDRQEFLLNTPDATYDLRDGSYKEHEAEDFITKVTAVSPNSDGTDMWLAALDSFFCGDHELTDYVQQVVGLAAIGKVYVEALIIAYGEGSNGKSTFWNTISRVLGTYSGTISADALTVGCKRNVKPEMAELKGKRLVIAAELEEGMRLNTSIVKQLCSTDEISAEKKYKDPFKYEPTHTLVLYTNHLPKVGANDDGIWRRLIVIPFNAKITGKSDIKNYSDFLAENAGGAIMNWIIEGAIKVIANDYKFKKPQVVQDAINRYRENNNWLGAFIEECCDVDPSYEQKSGELYQEYRAYCTRTGEYTRSTTDFYTALENEGFKRKKTKKGIIVYGIAVKLDFLEVE